MESRSSQISDVTVYGFALRKTESGHVRLRLNKTESGHVRLRLNKTESGHVRLRLNKMKSPCNALGN